MKKSTAKYFCEHCGSEVLSNAKFCPKCGKFFSSVRCPKCDFTGDVKTFIHGCPKCGYAVPIDSVQNQQKGKNKRLSRKSKNLINKAFSNIENSSKNKTSISEDTPAWLFIICILILIGIIAIMFWRCKN